MEKVSFDDRSVRILEDLLDIQAARQKVSATNLANIGNDTYEPRRVDFSLELDRAMNAGLRTTSPLHIRQPGRSEASVSIRQVVDQTASQDQTTRLEHEVSELNDAQLAYSTVARLMSKRLGTLRTSIVGKP
ncbi:MAG: flagellar basal body rod protein FlgB [bacterium]